MFFDSLGIDFGTGVYSFPDFPFANRPIPNSEIGDSVQLTGASSNLVTIIGTPDPSN